MPKAVIMPKFGFTQETAEVLAWLKQEGDHVDAGDPIMEVSTDKVSMEVEAPVSGTLAGFRYKQGDIVPVTEVVCYILAPGEVLDMASQVSSPAVVQDAPAPSPQAVDESPAALPVDSEVSAGASPLALRMAQDAGIDIRLVVGTGPRGRVTQRDVESFLQTRDASSAAPAKPNASPAARRLAQQLGVALELVKGSGAGGRIQTSDIEDYAETLRAATAAVEPTPRAGSVVAQPQLSITAPLSGEGVARRIPFNNMRRVIARNLQKSMQEAPHIYFQVDVDMTAANELVAYANANAPEGVKVTLTALITRAVAWTLRKHPLLNSHLNGEEILMMEAVNIGIAVALPEGLIVPVVRDADRKGIYDLAAEIRTLGQTAQVGKLGLDQIQGATFTISNLGMYAVDRFTAIINPPQVGILAVGRTRRQFVPDEQDQPVLRPIATITLSVDHRAIDGAVAARFIGDLAQALMHPERILL